MYVVQCNSSNLPLNTYLYANIFTYVHIYIYLQVTAEKERHTIVWQNIRKQIKRQFMQLKSQTQESYDKAIIEYEALVKQMEERNEVQSYDSNSDVAGPSMKLSGYLTAYNKSDISDGDVLDQRMHYNSNNRYSDNYKNINYASNIPHNSYTHINNVLPVRPELHLPQEPNYVELEEQYTEYVAEMEQNCMSCCGIQSNTIELEFKDELARSGNELLVGADSGYSTGKQ